MGKSCRIFGTLLLLNFLVLFLTVGGTEESEFRTWVDNYIKTYTVPQGKAVGLGVVVVNNNVNGGALPFYTGTFGFRDKEKGLPVTASSLHPLASISKSFASTLIVKILSEKFPQYGESVLEVPVAELLSLNLNNPVNWTLDDRYRTERVSFRDLLSHRTCLTGDITGAIFGAVQTTEEYIYRTRFEWEVCPFRTEYVYNNAMYCLAGALISQIAGQSFESLMKNFLIELGMTETRIGEINQSYASMTNMMQPYYYPDVSSQVVQKGNANLLRQLAVILPAAGIISTLNDMSKYLSFHMNAGTANGKQIISPQVHGWLTKTGIAISSDSTYGMGFELFVMKKGESPLLDHGGYYPPYVSQMDIYPDLGISLFTASSGPGGATQGNAIIQLSNAILSYFMNRRSRTTLVPIEMIPYKDYSSMTSPAQNQNGGPAPKNLGTNNTNNNKTRAAVSLKDLVGSFGAPVLGEIQVLLKDATAQSLKLTYGIWGAADLVPLDSSGYLYKIKWTSDILMYFNAESDGVSVENILEFETKNQFLWYSIGGNIRRFWRNADLSSWDEIPWSAGSC